MTTAQKAAWEIYLRRIEAQIARQRREYEAGDVVTALTFIPPTTDQIQVIERAMAEARQEGANAALDAIIPVIDRIDNSRSKKSPIIADVKQALDEAYEALHKLRGGPRAAVAVDPHAGGTTK